MEAAYRRLADEFRWEPGQTPMSDFTHLLAAEVVYFGVIFGLRAVCGVEKAGEAKQGASGEAMKGAMFLHNGILCLLSLAMFLGASYEAFARSQQEGVEWLFCEVPGTEATGGVYFWSYIYYLSKFLEFGDTVFKVLKRKPLDFLHVYHHAVVALMCWNWMTFAQSLQTLGLLANTGIHVVMYYYFALTIYRPPPWWKKFVTMGQIVQFQSSLVLALPFVYLQYTRGWVAGGAGCHGARAVGFNAAFNLSLLFLFVSFSRRTYTSKSKAA
eukprot:CAMPEP_0180212570 /NCGR_PEP_ID=MMETSP0987-20121128/13574_1 /TAXON_ID=697907 /ORGANISM="non described non described, Strain CCMP2293" /LENGTH=269 /DNA_ID=CAMNT_0022170253 /DNA_START=185 /DNA_END=994 /DNA_ORIENTATION=-